MGKLSTGQSTGTAYWTPGGSSAPGITNGQWNYDVFIVPSSTTAPSSYQLTAFPVLLSPSIAMNGVVLREGDDYTINYSTAVLTIYDSLTAADVLTARYEYSTFVNPGSNPLTAPFDVGHAAGYGDPTFAAVVVTPGANSGLLVAVQHIGYGWGPSYGALPSDPFPGGGVTLTDSWGLVWTKVGEAHIGENVGKSAVDIAAFVAPIPASLPAGTVNFHGAIGNSINGGGFAQRIEQMDFARYTGSAGVATRPDGGPATPLVVTLPVAPVSGQGVLTYTSQFTPNFAPTLPTGFTSDYLVDSGQPYGEHDWHQGAHDITPTPTQAQDWGFIDDNIPVLVAGLSLLLAPA